MQENVLSFDINILKLLEKYQFITVKTQLYDILIKKLKITNHTEKLDKILSNDIIL